MIKVIHLSLITSLCLFQEQNCLAGGSREHYNYELKDGSKTVYRGQTNDLNRREKEHLRDGKKFTHIKQVGHAKTKKGALKAEKESLKTYRKNHRGENPKYNKTDHG
jgi:predicted GIY-YIG superfamily endonuclease